MFFVVFVPQKYKNKSKFSQNSKKIVVLADNLSKFSQNSKKLVVLAKIHNMFA